MYKVETKFYKNGKVEVSDIEWVDGIYSVSGSDYVEKENYNLYIDYFKTQDEAVKYCEEH